PGGVVQAHGPACIPHGAHPSPLRIERVEGEPGRRAILDHHHAARSVRPLDVEAALAMSVRNRHVVVLGLGMTGLSAARWAARHGARVRVADTRAEPPAAARLAAELPRVPLVTGPLADATLAGAELIIISPGLPKDQAPIAAALARGAELVGDV